MKNYVVKALIDFNDVEEKNEIGGDTPRKAGTSIWNCTKERYEYLKSRNAVMLVGIDEIKEPIKEVKAVNVTKIDENIPYTLTNKKHNKKTTNKK